MMVAADDTMTGEGEGVEEVDSDDDGFGLFNIVIDDDDIHSVQVERSLNEFVLARGSPFTSHELNTTLHVMRALAVDTDLFDAAPLREFRQALDPLSEHASRIMFGGKSMRRFIQDEITARVIRIAKDKAKSHDRDVIDHRALRDARDERRKRLEAAMGDNVELVSDGPIMLESDAIRHMRENNNGHMNALTDGEEQLIETTESVADIVDKPNGEDQDNDDDDEVLESRLMKMIGLKANYKCGKPRSCYRCKSRFREMHDFYDQFCPPCAALNWEKRHQTGDLSGRVAIVTGARVKIGYSVALKLLRCGAQVIATSRFPRDTARRYAAEPDFNDFSSRLFCLGLDMRDVAAVEQFTDYVRNRYHRLDIIINNACQTIRRPPSYYRHMMPLETAPLASVSRDTQSILDPEASFHTHTLRLAGVKTEAVTTGRAEEVCPVRDSLAGAMSDELSSAAALSQISLVVGDEHDAAAFPEGFIDHNQQQIDLRSKHSWLLKLDEVSTSEAAEVLAINTLAPFIINSRLRSLMAATTGVDKFIINVSAMEGKFYRYKTPNHPHTNMAKAALNMMTRTCAAEYAASDRIYMNSVDTGWINDENPIERARAYADRANFQTPMDEEDARARILDQVFIGINEGNLSFGKFFKDFHESEW